MAIKRKLNVTRAIQAQRCASDPIASFWVSASAGTGKTKVLTDRVLSLLVTGSEPQKLICLTFTKAAAADAYMQTAIYAIQMHGGIGFTWDNDTHLWFKRAKSSEVFLGGSAYHRERMMQHWNV